MTLQTVTEARSSIVQQPSAIAREPREAAVRGAGGARPSCNTPFRPRLRSQACVLFPSLAAIHTYPLLTAAPCCHCPKVTGDPKATADCCSSQHFKAMTLHTHPRLPLHTHQKETKALHSPHPESCQSPLPARSPHCHGFYPVCHTPLAISTETMHSSPSSP